jgi:hypothetical protein
VFDQPALTPARVRWAYAVAITTDLLQLLLGPFGWAFVDEGLDVIAMAAISHAIGFHVVLLPTFALEFLPFTDMLPAWTGAVALVVALRRRKTVAGAGPPGPGPVIDV